MILVSTHAKLVAKNATIYKVTIPVQDVKVGDRVAHINPYSEHFASKTGAETFIQNNMMLRGLTVTPVAASSFNPWTER